MMCSSQEKCRVASFSEQTSTCRLDTTDNCCVATDIDVGWSTIARSCSKDACQLSEGYEFIEEDCYCMKYYDEKLEYDSASTVCRQDGGQLLKIIINSQSKQTMVESVLNDLFCVSVAVTVQGTRKTSTSPWLFDDGTAMNYFNWKVNEPCNDIIEFYIYLNPAVNWQWNDIDKKGKSFLCEIRV
ncbi:LAYN [Mytilus edulis]|uniref:LAYN n=1 Tax=Mytilus edulis TaxID=6550 RepID=A0A8S3VE18_MYTED|nr:LAYN [Mytilus edulis]